MGLVSRKDMMPTLAEGKNRVATETGGAPAVSRAQADLNILPAVALITAQEAMAVRVLPSLAATMVAVTQASMIGAASMWAETCSESDSRAGAEAGWKFKGPRHARRVM